MDSRRTMSTKFVICLNNKDYPASLEVRKLYERVEDETADKLGQIRIVDESGDDYLYPSDLFQPISLPTAIEELVANSS